MSTEYTSKKLDQQIQYTKEIKTAFVCKKHNGKKSFHNTNYCFDKTGRRDVKEELPF